MKKTPNDTLAAYIDALFPIIYIDHFDFRAIDKIIKDIAEGRRVIEFNNGLGNVDFKGKAPIGKPCDLLDFLNYHKDDGYDTPTFMVLKDVHNLISSPEVIGLLKYMAERNLHIEGYNQTVFIVSSKLVIPAELENYITVYDFPLPDNDDIKDLIKIFAHDYDIQGVAEDEKTLGDLAVSFKGLSAFQIKQILNVAYQDGGELNSDDKELILREKKQLIKKSGILETMNISEDINDVGGLEKLKEWLFSKEYIFKNLDAAMQSSVDTPKGIMIVGMPGCGKSLAAKVTAKLFDVPLVRLDIGRLMGKYVGESEENMRRALKLSEAISPCVLWIDEIEKAFSGIGGGAGSSDVMTRLFGQFLTWMQEKGKAAVFIVATANDISKIPAEFLRKGRFDELFFVDFPNHVERKKIFEIHLGKRKVLSDELKRELSTVAGKKTEGYNGADIEAIVKDAVERCFIVQHQNELEKNRGQRKNKEQQFVKVKVKLTTKDLEESIMAIKSISMTLGEQRIDKIRETVDELSLKKASPDPANGEDINFKAERYTIRAKRKGKKGNAKVIRNIS